MSLRLEHPTIALTSLQISGKSNWKGDKKLYLFKKLPDRKHSALGRIKKPQNKKCFLYLKGRVAGLGRLSAGAKMAKKPFVKRVYTIFATNVSFLRVIANLQIEFSMIYD